MDTKLNLEKLIETSESTGKSNYVAWRFKLNLLLRAKGLFDVATGTTVKSPLADNTYADWCKKDIEAQTIIGLNVDEKIALKINNCLEVDGLAQELRAAGEEIKDEWIISRILNSLPEKFNYFHSAWESLVDADKTLPKLMERLQQEKLRMKTQESQTISNALLTRGRETSGNKGQNRKGFEKGQSKTGSLHSGQ
ncbi:uncharacterized protein LOC114881056 [Osmia bicornis bicornis]|uniref:uncharacterized protein LOC114881056 n=1 Tax=Osmia bicornis bicornis TaxID=1437191 RepID=UPI0010F6B2DF|nr:uncharacterized protein LOC114881056 [Osmia bicornis bicornis]